MGKRLWIGTRIGTRVTGIGMSVGRRTRVMIVEVFHHEDEVFHSCASCFYYI